MEWYERRPSDYKEDTWHLTLSEHGAYTLLLDHYYASESPLPDNDMALSSICNCTPNEWKKVKPSLMEFFTEKNGKLRNKKCDTIISVSYQKRMDGAKRAAKFRKSKNKVTRDKRVSNASTLQDKTGQDNKNGYTVDFLKFWESYPNKKSKGTAFKSFSKIIKVTPIEDILEGIEKYKKGKEDWKAWQHPATWLHGEGWKDEYGAAKVGKKRL